MQSRSRADERRGLSGRIARYAICADTGSAGCSELEVFLVDDMSQVTEHALEATPSDLPTVFGSAASGRGAPTESAHAT